MTVLEFGLKSFFRRRKYRIDRDGAQVGEIECARRWEGATVMFDGTRYTAGRDGKMSGAFYIETNGGRLASADKPGAWKPLFTIRANGRTITLKKASVFSRGYVVTESDVQIGTIAPDGWFWGFFKAELPDELGPGLQAFLIWLVIVMTRRAMAQSAATGGIMAAQS